jgi:hypothetical protein
MSDLDLSEVDGWLADMKAAVPGLRAATRNPGKMQTPGVLCQITGLGIDTLRQDEWRVDINLVIVTAETDVVRATAALVEVLNPLRAFLGNPPGTFTPRPYTNDQGQTLPALNVPHTIRITD